MEESEVAQVDDAELKKNGFLKQVLEDHYALRVKVVGGKMKTEQLKKVYEIAETFGRGYVHMTSRQSIEIPYIKLEDINAVKVALAEAGLQPGAGGPRVRTITACQGNEICRSGIIDTTELANAFDERFYARDLPHKFKLGITGCRNNCLKAEENDLGVKGGLQVNWQEKECTYCGLCEAICPGKALDINIVHKEKILAAHLNPQQYPDLVVRVTGFTAYFAILSPKFRQLVVDRIIES